MSLPWKVLIPRSLVYAAAIALNLLTNAAAVAQEKKPDDADAKIKLNKALKEAAGRGDVATVQGLIKKGAEVQWRDPADNGTTPLVKSILLGRLNVVKVLLENGADIHYPDGSNRYPVSFCHSHRDKQKAIELLTFVLSKGGDKDLNQEPGMLVSLCDHEMGPPELMPILVAAGTNHNLIFKSKGATPLITAIQAKNPELRYGYVKALIDNKADVNCKDKKAISPLQWAKKGWRRQGHRVAGEGRGERVRLSSTACSHDEQLSVELTVLPRSASIDGSSSAASGLADDCLTSRRATREAACAPAAW
ncbi:MAG: ankyrin repeat domain-containing protein [Methylacidiphilales bacterium]|nr:ankyrin repeat domain-containing protein [Candidatus Methylacidiphilales bacterium]